MKKKKIKNMYNKMAINTYLLTTEYKQQNKQTSRPETFIDTENVLMAARWAGGVVEWVKKVKGLRGTNW